MLLEPIPWNFFPLIDMAYGFSGGEFYPIGIIKN